jgi:hypothetical protein
MFLDKKRDLLFLFISDSGTGSLTDALDNDKETWLKGQKISDKADEIPDTLQQTAARSQDVLHNTTRFQFMVYDIREEANKDFPHRPFESIRNTEPRWMYFKLENFDGSPDDPSAHGDTNVKYYRTNFWDAIPDPDDLDTFYLSHRGLGKVGFSEHANDLVKVTLKAPTPRATAGVSPRLDSYMSFERVYGFKGDQTGPDKYISSVLVTKMMGKKVVLVNSFRDLSNFSESRYMIAAANLVEKTVPSTWFTHVSSKDVNDSYYGLALAKNGNLLTISFFDESLRLFNVKFGENISLVKSIE